MRLEMRCAIWNFSTHHRGCLSETFGWNLNKMCYLKLLKCVKLENFQTYHGSWLFETFRWDLEKDVLFETLEPWNISNFSKTSQGLLIWNFQMKLKTFQTIQTQHGGCLLKLSNETWKKMYYLKPLKLCSWNFSNLKLCGSLNYLKLFKCSLRTKQFKLILNSKMIILHVHRVDIC